MSGHSKWAKTHRQKAATDAKRGAIFTKLGNLITIAASEGGGDDMDSNFKLRLAVEKARAANMPKDNIQRAIDRGTGKGNDGVSLEEATYEAFGPDNSAFIIEAVTDNKNRTISDIKIALNKNGGNLAGPNSVAWQFDRKGLITINTENKNKDELELGVIDAGADDISKDNENNEWEVITPPDSLQVVEENIKKLDIEISDSILGYKAKDEITTDSPEKIEKLFDALDDIDDVTNIYTNVA